MQATPVLPERLLNLAHDMLVMSRLMIKTSDHHLTRVQGLPHRLIGLADKMTAAARLVGVNYAGHGAELEGAAAIAHLWAVAIQTKPLSVNYAQHGEQMAGAASAVRSWAVGVKAEYDAQKND